LNPETDISSNLVILAAMMRLEEYEMKRRDFNGICRSPDAVSADDAGRRENPSCQEEGPSKESCCEESGQKVFEEVCNEKESRESVETRSRTETCCKE
jgi:hypothetical protein